MSAPRLPVQNGIRAAQAPVVQQSPSLPPTNFAMATAVAQHPTSFKLEASTFQQAPKSELEPLPRFIPAKETTADLDWAELATIDLSKVDTPEGRAEQAQRLLDALSTAGFFYVTGYETNLPEAEIDEQFAIGQAFHRLPLEEKLKYTPDLDQGRFNGYRPAGRTTIDLESGTVDKVSFYNIPKPMFSQDNHPRVIANRLGTVLGFQAKLHAYVLTPLLALLSVALGLPENYLPSLHKYDEKTEDHLRYMLYQPHEDQDYERLKDRWHVGGHTDLGTFTLLYRQPVAGLQIRDHDTGEWKYARPQPHTFTVNSADALSFLTGGKVKSTIHRVVVPPEDQKHAERHGLLYFSRPRNDVVLHTIEAEGLEGLKNEFEQRGISPPSVETWTYAKQKWQHRSRTTNEDQKARWNETVLPGHEEQLYK